MKHHCPTRSVAYLLAVHLLLLLTISVGLSACADSCNQRLVGVRTPLRILHPLGKVQGSLFVTDSWIVANPGHIPADISANKPPKVPSLWADLNRVHRAHTVALWGHKGAYLLQYRLDDSEPNWRFVMDFDGKPKVFRSFIKLEQSKQVLDESIVARHFRFIPIVVAGNDGSFTVEVYGCTFSADAVNFNGQSVIRTDLEKLRAISSRINEVRILLRTKKSNGVILSAVGSDGDLLLIQIRNGKIEVFQDFGSFITWRLSSRAVIDDGIWHSVRWVHRNQKIELWVDGVLGDEKSGYHFDRRIDLNRKLLVGSAVLVYPVLDLDAVVRSNFTGCLLQASFNDRDFLQGERINIPKNHENSCYDPVYQSDCVTLESKDAWVEVENLKQLWKEQLHSVIALEFRTASKTGQLAVLPFKNSSAKLKLMIVNGSLSFTVEGLGIQDAIREAVQEMYVADLLWHRVQILIFLNEEVGHITLTVDSYPSQDISAVLLNGSQPGTKIRFGGSDFQGCIRHVTWDNKEMKTSAKSGRHRGAVSWDSCTADDQCYSYPCKNGGTCIASLDSYTCTCSDGYFGENCNSATFPYSCKQHLSFGGLEGEVWLDIDGPGKLTPFRALCNKTGGDIVTVIQHDQPDPVEIRGFARPGSFEKHYGYGASLTSLDALVSSFDRCSQLGVFECFGGAKFMHGPTGRPMSWWMGRKGSYSHSWGGPGFTGQMCTCGQLGTCLNDGDCNCDSGLDSVDEAVITKKDHLPIKKMLIGDTDNHKKWVRVTVGPLQCAQKLAWLPVTFRERDASLLVTTNTAERRMMGEVDVYLEFMTTQQSGVLIYNQQSQENDNMDWLKLYLNDDSHIVGEISAAGSLLTLDWKPENGNDILSDDNWHSVHFQMNFRSVSISVDGNKLGKQRSESRFFVLPILSNKWKIGSSSEYSAGFAGVLRGLYINGEGQDLQKLVENSDSGVKSGIVRRCEDTPCLNHGICIEHYDSFSCDCSKTTFTGPTCSKDLGFEFSDKGWMEYSLKPGDRKADGDFRIGFQTNVKDTEILFGSSYWAAEQKALNLSLTTEGYLKLIYFDGLKSYRLIDSRKNYADGTYYDVKVQAQKNEWILQIGYYEALKLKTDQFIDATDIGKWTIGSQRFVGCISRLHFGEAVPFQKTEESRFKMFGGMTLKPTVCPLLRADRKKSVEGAQKKSVKGPITSPAGLPSIVIEPVVKEDKFPIVAAGLSFVILILVLFFCCLWRCYRGRPGGEYKTHEGDQLYLTPDNSQTALVAAVRPTRREWFI